MNKTLLLAGVATALFAFNANAMDFNQYVSAKGAFVKMKNDTSAVREDGLGKYTISNAEYCLLATKGRILERKSHSILSAIISPIREHSRKPEEVRERIVKLFGELPRIELFARQTVAGWDCWGNETEKFKG